MAQVKGKFTDEELATANKKEIAQAIKDQASPQFLTNHKLTGSVKYLVKHTNKAVLIAAYRNLYETKDFKPEAKKAASVAPAGLPGTSGKVKQEADMEAPSESWSTTSESWSTASEGGSPASESWSTTSESWSTASEGGSPVSEAADHDLRLDDETRSRINSSKVYLISNLNAAPCIDLLQSYGLINPDMYDELESKKSNPREQVNDLLFLVGRSSRLFSAFILALQDSNQHEVIRRLTAPADGETAVTAPADCGSLSRIKDRHHLIIDNLRFEGNLLTHLDGRRVLTTSQVDELMSILTRRDRAQRLLRLLEKGETTERTRGLVSALYETDQPHLAHLIETGDDSEIINKQLKLDARGQKLEIMAGVRRHIQQASLPTLLSSLEHNRMLTPAQSEVIQAAGNPELQCQQLVDMVTCRPWPVVRDNLVTDPHTSQVTFRVPALEGTSSSDSDKQTQHSAYIRGLKASVKDEAIRRNKQLNERFGIHLDTVLFCDLAMADQLSGLSDHLEDSKETWKVEDYIRRTAESLQIKGKISIDDIFKSSSGQEPRRVLLLGGAGMGKTTVLQEQARRWSEGELPNTNIQACYRFECRNFTYDIKEKNKMSLAHLLHKQHGPNRVFGKDQDTITQFVADHESEILLAIDGLDELAEWKSCGGSTPVISDITQSAEIHHIVYNLIHKRLLPESKVLVTTRPISSARQRDFERNLVALGFSEDSIKECMRALCKTEELATEVVDYIYRTNLVADCIVPLTCILLGVVLRRDLSQKSGDQLPSSEINSMTRLYSRVSVDCMWSREENIDQVDMLSDLTDSKKTSILQLAGLAARGMFGKETVILFDNSDLKAVGMRADGEWFGLLEVSLARGPFLDYQHPVTASFLHLTVEEFLAAVHLSLTWEPAHLETLANIESQRLDIVAMFSCGVLGDPEGRRFLKALSPRMTDQTAESRVKELLTKIGPEVDPEVELEEDNSDVDKLARLQILRCVSEGKLGDLVPTVEGRLLEEQSGLQTLDLTAFPGGLLPHHLAAVGYGVQFSQITFLSLQACEITGQGVQALERSSRALTGLKKLELTGNPLEDAGMAALGSLLDRNTGLQELWLWSCQITGQGVQALVRTSPHLTGLRRLELYQNSLGDDGASALGPLLTRNPGLHTLGLGDNDNDMGDAGAASVCSALRGHTEIRELGLSDNKITDLGADLVADLLRANPGVQKIDLGQNNLSKEKKTALEAEFRDRIDV